MCLKFDIWYVSGGNTINKWMHRKRREKQKYLWRVITLTLRWHQRTQLWVKILNNYNNSYDWLTICEIWASKWKLKARFVLGNVTLVRALCRPACTEYQLKDWEKTLMHFVCVFARWVMSGTCRVVSRSVYVTVEVWSSVTTAAVYQPLRAASYKTESMSVAL